MKFFKNLISNCSLLQKLPYKEVRGQQDSKNAIYKLIHLGNFSVSENSCFIKQTDEAEVKEIVENVEIVQLNGKTEYKPHLHKNSSAIIYISFGSGVFLLGEKSIQYKRGDRIFIPSGLPHGFITDEHTLFLSIQSPPIINPSSGEIDLYY